MAERNLLAFPDPDLITIVNIIKRYGNGTRDVVNAILAARVSRLQVVTSALSV